jgi:hypothetical protein
MFFAREGRVPKHEWLVKLIPFRVQTTQASSGMKENYKRQTHHTQNEGPAMREQGQA